MAKAWCTRRLEPASGTHVKFSASFQGRPLRSEYQSMKMIAEYLENAAQFERMAADESNIELKSKFLKQAEDYRRLAAKRATQLGVPMPPANSK